jgi:hypothetical protein
VKRDIQENDEEAVQVKEQSILELGSLLAKTGQAAGKCYKKIVLELPGEVPIFLLEERNMGLYLHIQFIRVFSVLFSWQLVELQFLSRKLSGIFLFVCFKLSSLLIDFFSTGEGKS